jgi:replicative DNA helicase
MKETDKPLPQAPDAEESVIGICLLFPDAIYEICGILEPEMFYVDTNKLLFKAMLEVVSKGGSADSASLTVYLQRNNLLDLIGGVTSLMHYTDKIVSNQLLMNHALIVKQTHLLRAYIDYGHQLIAKSYSDDLSDVKEFAETQLFSISNISTVKEPRSLGFAVNDVLDEVDKIYKHEKKLIGIPSGFTEIDRITGGWQEGNLIILAGRPAMGKTALALCLAKNAASMNFPVVKFSMEMSEAELATRYISGASGYTNTEIRSAKVNYDKLMKDAHKLNSLPIYIDDSSSISILELRSKIKKLVIRNNIKLVVVDYLQLMKGEGYSREQEISQISRGLKSIAKEFNISILALSQLNRDVENRGDRIPRLSDLRESGAIEQDADIVILIYRPAYYKLENAFINGVKHEAKGLIVFDIAKNRNGALVSCPLYHNDSMTIISDEKLNI